MVLTLKGTPLAPLSRRIRRTPRVVSLWLAGDVVYAALPIVVLAIITFFLGRPFLAFAEIKEWSFANIVLFGVVLRRFIRLKVQVQQRPRSYKIDAGIQLFLLCLIGSVLVLVLVVLKEMEYFKYGEVRYLGHAQVTLFTVALLSLLAGVWEEDAADGMESSTEHQDSRGPEQCGGNAR